MEDVEVSVSSGHGGEGGFRECMGMEGFEVLNLILTMSPKVMSVLSNLQVANVLGHFWLLFLIRENKGVMVTTAGVILHPTFSWMVGVLILLVTVVSDSDV